MKKLTIKSGLLAALLAVASSCMQDLDRQPITDVTSASVYADPNNYQSVLAKLYATLAVTGQQGPSGKPDIGGIDEGFSSYLRQYWQAQELPTDEAVIAWNDGSLPDFHNMSWTSSNEFITALYNRIFYIVTLSNEFIRETSDARLSERGVSGQQATDIRRFRAEARFLRALAYWNALDLFGGNVPFVTEANTVGAFLPTQTNRTDLFAYVESELKAIEPELAAPRAGAYGRADQGAVWMLLAKLYLNAEVYTGTARWNDAVTYTSRIIASNQYALEANYQNLFRADNNNSREIILPITFDGTRTLTFGGTTFLVHAAIGGSMNPSNYGVGSGWAGLRTTRNLVEALGATSGTSTDRRAIFYTNGQTLDINQVVGSFTDGFAVPKFQNVTSAGRNGVSNDFPDTDFPYFRLGDVYLMYAEAVVRGGTGGTVAQALQYVNALRTRAGVAPLTTLTLQNVFDERTRELYWEAHRRTDLIRFGRFTTGAYLWPWKGGVRNGRAVEDFRNVYPIPAADVIANPSLKQNTGY